MFVVIIVPVSGCHGVKMRATLAVTRDPDTERGIKPHTTTAVTGGELIHHNLSCVEESIVPGVFCRQRQTLD